MEEDLRCKDDPKACSSSYWWEILLSPACIIVILKDCLVLHHYANPLIPRQEAMIRNSRNARNVLTYSAQLSYLLHNNAQCGVLDIILTSK